MQSLQSRTLLNNGVEMPWFGLGVYKTKEGKEVQDSVRTAIEYGYRSIDTAAIYQNEEGVGIAIKDSGIKREELFVTTKLWNSEQGYESTLRAMDESLKKLQLDYVDLYLIHWPVPALDKYMETWKAFEKLYKDGYARAIGVSNFQIHHLQKVMQESDIVPAVNQVEYHPELQQRELREFCRQNQIQLEAWSPLGQGKLLEHPVLCRIAEKHGKTTAQIILRWDLQNEVVTIPKSITPSRIESNTHIFDFELDADDMQQIAAINKDQRIGPDPDEMNVT